MLEVGSVKSTLSLRLRRRCWFEFISDKLPRHVSAEEAAVDKDAAPSRHFLAALKAFIKSFDMLFFLFLFASEDTPLAARLACERCALATLVLRW